MTKIPDDFTNPKLRDACQARCVGYGEPPCYEVMPGVDVRGEDGPIAKACPCGECLRDIGIEPGDEFDENAAIARML